MPSHDTPPAALQAATQALAQRRQVHLRLVPAAYQHWWSILRYTDEGEASVFLPAREAGELYATVRRMLEGDTPCST